MCSSDLPAVRHIAFTPDHRWLLVGGWKSPQVALGSLPELRHHRNIADSDNAAFAFGNDGQTALIGTPHVYRVLDTNGWNGTHVLPRAESPSRLITSYVDLAGEAPLAVCQWTHDSVRLLDVHAGEWLATIPVKVTTGLDQLHLTADGSALAIAGERHVVEWWDLRELNRELVKFGLGWEMTDDRK